MCYWICAQGGVNSLQSNSRTASTSDLAAMDYGKGALVFTTFAIHIHSLTIAMPGGYNHAWGNDDDDKGRRGRSDLSDRLDAVKAFLIMAFLLYLVTFLLQVIMKTGEDLKLSNKIIGIILFILLIIGGLVLYSSL